MSASTRFDLIQESYLGGKSVGKIEGVAEGKAEGIIEGKIQMIGDMLESEERRINGKAAKRKRMREGKDEQRPEARKCCSSQE